MSWILAFCGFAALIVLHEFGHFLAAKAVGMRVERFSLFFGPMFAKFRRGETTYGIGPIPLGGYVKITGMNPAEDIPPEVAHRAYFRQPVWKRIVVIAAGPAMNLLIAFVLFWAVFVFHGTAERRNVDSVETGQPAAGVLHAGDRIVSVDGKRDPQDFQGQIASHTCAGTPSAGCRATSPVRITVLRGGQRRTVELTPVYDAQLKRTRVGFAFAPGDLVKESPVQGAREGLDTMWQVTSGTVTAIVKIFYDSQARDEVSGVVGSYEATRQSFDLSTAQALFILGVISLSLAVVNLFPFLPLDGGHIFWALAEKVRGRAIPFSVMERAGIVGFALVAILFFIGLSNDIGRLTGEGFNIR
jgi:regulator of sigma E protease